MSNPVKCKCIYCGKTWSKGDEGDNEIMCLRCERIAIIEDSEPDQRDYL